MGPPLNRYCQGLWILCVTQCGWATNNVDSPPDIRHSISGPSGTPDREHINSSDHTLINCLLCDQNLYNLLYVSRLWNVLLFKCLPRMCLKRYAYFQNSWKLVRSKLQYRFWNCVTHSHKSCSGALTLHMCAALL